MPYDASANGSAAQANSPHRRGPLRPSRLASARARVGGDTLTRLVQLTDLTLLGGLIGLGWVRGESPGAAGLLLAASGLVAASLVKRRPAVATRANSALIVKVCGPVA